jgi:diacylglycerol kinase family enzyme
MTKRSRIILHGKQGANQELRDAVAAVREDGHDIDVRVTWEAGDSGLFAAEASKDGIDVTVNTNPKLKRLLGGAAYFITGLGRFSELEPKRLKLHLPESTPLLSSSEQGS